MPSNETIQSSVSSMLDAVLEVACCCLYLSVVAWLDSSNVCIPCNYLFIYFNALELKRLT